VRSGPEIERLRISGAIPDASPLIFLFRSAYDWVFPRLYENVFIAEAVWQEVVAGKDEAARLLPEASWAKRKGGGIAPRVAVFNLGSGESEVLSLALNSPGYHAVLDDAAGRRCAAKLDVPYTGTGGLLLVAKKQGLIPSVSEALGKLTQAGLWLAPNVERLLRDRAGEK
jgi:predicted nucleic acid-binding protein